MFDTHLPVWIIVLPFFTSLVCFMTGRRIGTQVGFISALILMILTFVLGMNLHANGSMRYAMGGWASPLGIGIQVDGLTAVMLIFTAIAGSCISVYASGYFRGRADPCNDKRQQYLKMERYFWPIWLFAWGGLNVLFLSADIFNIYVALEIISFSAIALVALKGSLESLLAATRYFYLTLLGSLVYLLGVSFLYSAYGTLDIALLKEVATPDVVSAIAVALITIGLLIKTSLFPMHFWLPPAHANSPAPVSAILSSLVVMGAFYLLVRLWFGSFAAIVTPTAGQLLGVLGCICIVGGAWMAIRQERLKMMLAYSTIAQIGYMFLLFPLITAHTIGQGFAWSGGIYFSIAHACAKAAAFMVAGAIMYALGHDRIQDLQGLAKMFPIGVFAFAIAGTSLMGLPPSGGFIGKWMLLKAAMLSGQWWYAVFMLIGSVLSAFYIFRFLEIAFQKVPEGTQRMQVPQRMRFAALTMACIAVALGLIAIVPLEILKIDSPVSFKSMEGFVR